MIHPAPSDIPDAVRTISPSRINSRCCFCLERWFLKFSRCWAVMNLSYRGGKYSVERLLALEEYTRKHSLLHVIVVCVVSFIPTECFIIAQESVPLQDPALGWQENYGFWVRAALVIGAVLYTATVQAKYLLRGFVISNRQLVLLLICVVIVQMIVAVTFAANVWFPIPFTVITLVPTFYVVSIVSIWFVVGMTVIREVLKHREQLLRFGSFVASQQFMAVIYPAYQVLFHAASGTDYQLPVILLLPVIKLIVKNIAMRCVAHMEDMMPEEVIFTVDFFNALYMATIGNYIISIAPTNNTILMRLNAAVGPLEGTGNLLSMACQLCKHGDQFEKQNRQRIKIRSCIEYNISPETRELLHRLDNIPRIRTFQGSRRNSTPEKQIDFNKIVMLEKRRKLAKCATWVERRDQSVVSTIPTSEKKWKSSTSIPKVTQETGILREALEVLFTTECLLLSAFLDAFVPFFYGIFMFVMVHLQSAKYHSELAGVTNETIGDVVDSIFVFSVVEFVALVLLAVLICRNLGMNAVYHLAFVLETQIEFIQSKLLVWVTMTLAFRVVHFGVDFTFQFEWLSNSK